MIFSFFFHNFSRILLSKHFKMLNLFYSVGIILFSCVFTNRTLSTFYFTFCRSNPLNQSNMVFLYISSFIQFLLWIFLCLCVFAFSFFFLNGWLTCLLTCFMWHNRKLGARGYSFASFLRHFQTHIVSDLYTWFGHTCCH